MSSRNKPKRPPSRRKAPPSPPAAGPRDTFPSTAHQFKPGQSGNPKGRTTAGATVREHYNAMAEAGLTREQLQRVAADPRSPFPRAIAAQDILRAMERGDLADMEPLLDGGLTLRELRESGVNTAVIRKVKVRTRTLRDAEGNDAGTEVEREVELHDRAGEAIDRICDATDGRPRQQVDLSNADGSLRTQSDGAAEAAAILAELGLPAGTAPPRAKP